MSLTGKTIGELALLSGITQDTLFAVELSGITYYIPYSGFSQSLNYTEVTYSELYNSITGETLTPGSYYLITDFRTCYDQPDFDSNRNSITIGNYKQSDVEPIMVLATSTSTISTDAYQPMYPNDKIKYDWTFNTTEVTNGEAFGRISERIDEYGNRTDYDHRTILFKRYTYIEFYPSNPLTGIVSVVSTSDTEMTVTGTDTNFTSLNVGDYVGFGINDNFKAYEIVSISGNTEMYITGLTTTNLGGVKMYLGNSYEDDSYYQNNISTAYTEYFTFDFVDSTYLNNYIGNYANMYVYDENPFILANNVFRGGPCLNNKLNDGCYNNTFDDDCSNNTIGNYFYNNITDDDFDGNVIGNWFRDNRITSNFQYNRIGENFQNNYLVQNSFYRNNIMNYFEGNIIDGDDFQNNEIGSQFAGNYIFNSQFYKNDIGNGFNDNNIYSEFTSNLIGNGYNGNDIYCQFYENYIGDYFNNNNLGNPLSYGSFSFNNNRIDSSFYGNTCLGDFAYNTIGSNFTDNNIEDGFGFGFNSSQGNVIGNYFYNNTIGEYFYNNTISDGFYDNQVYNYFQMNNVKIPGLNNIDFTEYYGNITGFNYVSNGTTATDNSYTNLTGSTNGNGINASFDVTVTSGFVFDVTLNNIGKYYALNNTFTILGSQIGGTDGDDDIVVTIIDVSQTPSVYEPYNSELFKNANNTNRLSYYDASDILTIKNINE